MNFAKFCGLAAQRRGTRGDLVGGVRRRTCSRACVGLVDGGEPFLQPKENWEVSTDHNGPYGAIRRSSGQAWYWRAPVEIWPVGALLRPVKMAALGTRRGAKGNTCIYTVSAKNGTAIDFENRGIRRKV